MTFLSELRRRKVFRVAAVYPATAFAVLQAADTVWSTEHAALRRDPRFVDYLRRQGVVDLWRRIGPPRDCVQEGDTSRCGMSRQESDR